jgi:hypothetical protein
MKGSRDIERSAGFARNPESLLEKQDVAPLPCNDAPSRPRRRSIGLSVLALCLAWLAGGAFADPAGAPGNPIGPGIVPPSSYEKALPTRNSTPGERSSLANFPGAMGSSGNLVMTGNVGGGKYFHGYVPYGSTTSLGAPLGSTQLDSFLRYTSVPRERGGYAGGYNPFYSSTGTATTTLPGYGGAVLVPSSPRAIDSLPGLPSDRPADVLTPSEMSPYQAGAGPKGSTAYGNYGGSPAAVSTRVPGQDFGLRIADCGLNAGHEATIANPQSAIAPTLSPGVMTNTQQVGPQNSGLITPEDYRLQLEQLQQDIERVKANALALEQSLKTNDVPAARAGEVPAAQAAESGAPVTPSAAVTLPQELPSRPAGRVRPDEGLLLEPRVPDKTPVPAEPPSVNGPRVTDVQWLRQKDRTDGVSPAGADPFRAPPSPVPTPPERSLPAPTAATGRIDAVFAPQGRSGAATDSLWTQLPALQVQQVGQAVPGTGNPALPPAPGVKPSPEQVSAFIARLRATPAAGNPGANPTGSNPTGALPGLPQQLVGDHLLQTYRSPCGTPALPGDDESARVAASRPQALGMADSPLMSAPNSGSAGSFMQESFDRCLETAELYLRQGRYYRAAELFMRAGTYKPNDGRVLLGRCYALFGAGEYLSSAVYLARTLEQDPRAVLDRSDLVNAIGGPAVFAARITDLGRCAGTGDAPQLQFLLAYVYSQMNRPAEAKAAIEAAEKQLPPSPALDLLRAIVARP